MSKFCFRWRAAPGACAAVLLGASVSAQDRDAAAVAGSDRVAEVIQTYEGRGVLADDSEPTPPDEALEEFALREGLVIDLVASEPDVTQPLSLAWDSKGRLWVVQYRQYQFPAGLKIVEYDNHLRARFDRDPLPPPHGDRGDDLISVLEDTNGDGHYDQITHAIEGLNIATSVAVGAGGIWIANPPYLLFYPDADGDGLPDGDPEVMLSGFGIEDTHSVMNSLLWGPDGWLYGVNGSTTTGRVQDPASGEWVEWQGQMVWRYDPPTKRFEIYAEGGGNTFSLEIDDKGHVFSGTNNGNTRGMYYPQGSYGRKSWGKHGPLTNPYAFGYFQHMEHDGDTRRFAQAFAIYEDELFPEEYQGRIFAPNSLHNVVWSSRLERDGSTYRTVDEENLLESGDRWFRPVYGGVGADGAFYMADWYDTRLSHVRPVDDWRKDLGRLYRIRPEGSEPVYAEGDLSKRPAAELLALLDHPTRHVRRRAVLEIGWRGETSLEEPLAELVEADRGQASLEALWALNLLGALDDERALRWLAHPGADVRRWIVRLLGDRRAVSPAVADGLAAIAQEEEDVQTRVQLAASAKRLPAAVALPIVGALLGHEEDLEDKHQPLMLWWAVEAHAESAREEVEAWLAQTELWERSLFLDGITERLMKRYAIAGGELNFASSSTLLGQAPDEPTRAKLLEALQGAFEGVAMPLLPPDLSSALEEFADSQGESGLVVRLRNGDATAVPEATQAIFDDAVPVGVRGELIRLVGEVADESSLPALQRVIALDQEHALKRVALQTMGRLDQDSVAEAILRRYDVSLPAEHEVRGTAERVLASRPRWASMMMDAVDRALVKSYELPPDVVQIMMQHEDPELKARLADYWPGIVGGAGGIDLEAESSRIREVLSGGPGDWQAGKIHYATRCGICHPLFGEGVEVGPDLTGYERSNLTFWLDGILNPSLELREGYITYVATMNDGRILSGLLHEQTPRTVTFRDPGGNLTLIDRSEIADLSASPISMMPPGLLSGLDESELRDLFAYLMKE